MGGKSKYYGDLEPIFEEARKHLASLPWWRITLETRDEIKRLEANIRASENLDKPALLK